MQDPKSPNQGPFLSAAFLCERILEEKDGVKSVIRLIDRITRQAIGPEPPEEMEPFEHPLTLFIRLKKGRAQGRHTLRVRIIKPSGESPPEYRSDFYLEGEEDWGMDFVIGMKLRIDQVGIYWFRILFNDSELTRLPLRVLYMPRVIPLPPSSGGNPPQG